MSGLHAAEIDCLLRRTLSDVHPYMGSSVRWLGVFARDELPNLNKERRPFALVLNTDPSSKPGQHWLALFGPKEGPIEIFDSFGLHTSSYGLAYLLPTYSLIQLQSSFSALCGHYCIFFLNQRSNSHVLINHNSFYRIIDFLRKTHIPDNFVNKYVETLQRTYRIIKPCNRNDQCSKLKCSFC